jgi:cytochrome c
VKRKFSNPFAFWTQCLNGLDGRKAGTVPNFDYSDANKNSGIVWNEETFEDYIKNPAAKIPTPK